MISLAFLAFPVEMLEIKKTATREIIFKMLPNGKKLFQ